MKKDYDYAAKVITTAALAGNTTKAVIDRMITYIVNSTVDTNVICSLLQGLIIGAKINNKQKLIEIVSNKRGENICEIINIEVVVRDQDIRIEYICKRYAQKADETQYYNTKRKQDEAYAYEVKVQDSCRISVNEVDWDDAIEFEIV